MPNDGGLSNFIAHLKRKHRDDVGQKIMSRWSLISKNVRLNIIQPLSAEDKASCKSLSVNDPRVCDVEVIREMFKGNNKPLEDKKRKSGSLRDLLTFL